MSWNYRRRVKILPGVHLNFSKSGVSTSVGPKGTSVTFGKNGTYLNTSIPGTGLYNRQKISGSKGKSLNTNNIKNNNNDNGYGCLISAICFLLMVVGGVCIISKNMVLILTGLVLIGVSIIVFCVSVVAPKKGIPSSNDSVVTNNTSHKEDACSQKSSKDFMLSETSTNERKKYLGVFDPLLEDVVVFLTKSGIVSTSMIQRRFSIGFHRAGRIMDQLEKIGVVGPANGASPRELLIRDNDGWLIIKSRLMVELAKQKNQGVSSYEDAERSLPHCLTKDQFNLIKSTSDNLCSFMIKIGKKRNVRAKLDEILQIENNDGSPWPISKKVQIATFADIYRCYNGLGHNFSLDDDEENIGIYLFMAKYLQPETIITFDSASKCRFILKDSFADVLETSNLINQNVKLSPKEFILQKVLGECDRELQIQYMSLLYRFASAVAKADGQVNETEENWLAEIVKSQETNIGNGSNVRTTTQQKQDSLESPYDMLNGLIGLTSVKDEIARLTNFIKIQQVRESKGLKTPDISYHCVFTGNPGTGKTTVARIMASIYKDLGILKKGHLVETDRSGLVAEYVGQTAVKTNKIIDSALDGVLFVDEAYSLVQGSKEDFGQEAIATLLKRMEDDRNRLIVILAGYGSEMKKFIDSNPGLQSRFNRYIHFPDYTSKELKEIFLLDAKKSQYTLHEHALEKLEEIMSFAIEHKDENFGNARFVRNLFEKSIQNQAMRLSSEPKITEEILSKLEAVDLPLN